MGSYSGTTQDAKAPFIPADFWKEGTQLKGRVEWRFHTKHGEAYALKLDKAIELNGEKTTLVSVGNQAGFVMALRGCGVPGGRLLPDDEIMILCNGTEKSPANRDMAAFSIRVDRKEESDAGPESF